MKDKRFIVGEIQRTASLRGGKPLGQIAFRKETGITEYEWHAYWARWGDALIEAGFESLGWNVALDENAILRNLACLVRKYGRYPAKGEFRLESKDGASIPTLTTLQRRFGGRAKIIKKLRDFCVSEGGLHDVLEILAREHARLESKESDTDRKPMLAPKLANTAGHVYLVKSGALFKIGCSENHWRRKGELHNQTSQGIIEVHTISAIDDPRGIEKYWHERFADKRRHGEWFDLTPHDIDAFRKRKFM